MVSEIIAKVATPQVYGEKLVKPAMIACANDFIAKDAAFTKSTIPLTNDTLSHQTNNTGGDMEETLYTDIHVINFVTSN